MSEFKKLYYSENSSNKPNQKIKLEFPRRSHKALMILILACDEGGNPKCVGKMNFIDLAGTNIKDIFAVKRICCSFPIKAIASFYCSFICITISIF